jgi:predicted TIM-barrel fold metal-dependent hydrolase
MIIDSHTHIFSKDLIARRNELAERDERFRECYSSPKAKMATAVELVQEMERAGIDRAVVTGYAFADGTLCAASNDHIIEAIKAFPDKLVGLAAIQPLDGDKALYEAERCYLAGLRGLGELTADGQGFDLTKPALFHDLAALTVKYKGVIMLHASEPLGHLYPGKGKTTPDKILALAQHHPECNIIAAHWGGGLPFYELMPEVAKALSNLYYDTAATTYLYRFGVFRAVCDLVGAHKILWATDYPLLGQARLLERVRRESMLNEIELEQILGGNAARLLGLEEKGE